MPPSKVQPLMIEDATILFRNFGGREQQFNSAGDRNFCVVLDPKQGEELKKEGWNVKYLKAREEDDVPKPYLQVKVNYNKGRPPRVVMITSKNRVDLGADEVEMIDAADIKTVDIIVNPYSYEVNGNSGISAYLKSAFVTIAEDELELKYADAGANQSPRDEDPPF